MLSANTCYAAILAARRAGLDVTNTERISRQDGGSAWRKNSLPLSRLHRRDPFICSGFMSHHVDDFQTSWEEKYIYIFLASVSPNDVRFPMLITHPPTPARHKKRRGKKRAKGSSCLSSEHFLHTFSSSASVQSLSRFPAKLGYIFICPQ